MRPRPVIPHPADPALALVELTRGKWAVIDAAYASDVGRYNWSLTGSGYAVHAFRDLATGKFHQKPLHRFIAELAGMDLSGLIDHKNHNTLDDRSCNLRPATTAQNAHNRKLQTNNISGHKGIYWNARERMWRVSIMANGRRYVKQFENFRAAVDDVYRVRVSLHAEFGNHGTN